jgi:hypothetical protein
MFRRASLLALLAGTTALSIIVLDFGLGNAQAPAAPQGAAPQTYRPGLGDLMTMTVQPRHIKLGLAGQEKNWIYAAYELHELEESFERVARVWPTYRSTNIAELMVATTKAPMDAVSEAIKSADATKFNAAYARLTATCNACHQSTERAFIVIQTGKTSTFPDQDFRLVKP